MGRFQKIAGTAKDAARVAYKDATLKRLYPARYKACLSQPVRKGYVVFLEVREKALSDNFRLIKAGFEHRNRLMEAEGRKAAVGRDLPEGAAPEAAAGKNLPFDTDVFYTFDTVCIREGMDNPAGVVQKCLSAIPKIAAAEFVFVSESSYFLSSLPIRPETTVIQTWHACGAFKKFGYSAIGQGFGTTREDLEKYPVHKNFDYVTVSGNEVVWAYAQAFHMEDRADRILPIGVSRTDWFFHPAFREKAVGHVNRVLREMASKAGAGRAGSAAAGSLEHGPYSCRLSAGGNEAGGNGACSRKIILYAPTFRGSVGHAKAPDRMDIVQMKEKLSDEYVLLIKQHPFVRNRAPIPKEAEGFAFDVSDQLPIEELMTAADICITDYSSIVFEYSLFEKPILFFAYDLDEYKNERGFYYPVEEMMPGPVSADMRELVRDIHQAESRFDLKRVRDFKYRFMGGCDGHATARVLKLCDQVRKREDRH